MKKMEMMFLIIKLGYGSVVIPDKYKTDQCQAIAETINKSYTKEAICVPAPAKDCRFSVRANATNPAMSETVKVCYD